MAVLRFRRIMITLLPPVLTLAGLLLVLQVVLPVLRVPSFILPQPSSVLATMLSPRIPWLMHSAVTVGEALGGFALAVSVGIPVAILMSLSRAFRLAVEPLTIAAQVAPKIAFVPILFLWLGVASPLPRILTVFLVCLFPIVIDTASGLASVDEDMIDLMRSFNASRLDILAKVALPGALPHVFSGLKIAVALAMVGAVVAEFVSSSSGLGYLINASQVTLDASLAFAAASILIVVAFVFYLAVVLVERIVVPWTR